ncbi:MAG: hypothetical protein ABIZ34_00325, partial [Candidatus Limnocylindrales bacterium]
MAGARIVSVHRADVLPGSPAAMDRIRFVRLSEALARQGHHVDMVLAGRDGATVVGPGLREIGSRDVDWDAYDLVITFFHRAIEALIAAGGGDHRFIVSDLGSVVGPEPSPGVYFFGPVRDELWAAQLEMVRRCRAVVILTEQSAALWRASHGPTPPIVLVPTGVDADIPPLGPNPYAAAGITRPVVLFAGNLYANDRQGEVNLVWQDRLNRLGRALRTRGLELVAMGTGDIDRLDPSAVTHVGEVDYRDFWQWQRHAAVGVVLAHGPVQDNESSKIYYELRAGLPVICERPVPN